MRNSLVTLVLTAVALSAPAARHADAGSYPARPVRIVVGFAAGGAADIAARMMGQCYSERLGHQFIVENRPGAASNIAAESLVNAPADGYALLLVSLGNAVNATLYDRLNFDVIRDIAPVAGILQVPLIAQVHPSVPVKTVPEFIAYAKSSPGKVSYGSAGNGTATHMGGELFKMMAGVDIVHVPYRGEASALTDLLGGQVQVVFGTMSSSIEYIKARRLRAIGISSVTRSGMLPEIPTVSEYVPGYVAAAWAGIGAPKHTPTEIIAKLNREANACLTDPKFRSRLADFGATALPLSPAEFGEHIAAETAKWGKVVKFAGVKAQ